MRRLKVFFGCFLLLPALAVLLGCGPRYEVRDVFVPPTSSTAQQCTRDCGQSRIDCRSVCRQAFSSCGQEAETEAQRSLATALEIYAAQLDAYDAQQRLYDREYAQYRSRKSALEKSYDHAKNRCYAGDQAACREKKQIKKERDNLRGDYYGFNGTLNETPQRPVKPTLAEETARIRADRCDADCSCQVDYKACYTGCGGRVESERYCVSNCDEE